MMPLDGRTIVVTDDDPDQITYMQTVLEDNGATVIPAHNGTEALEFARAQRPDLVTLDINMPGMDVGEVFTTIKADPDLAGIKICIISGRPELRSVLFDLNEYTPDGYLDKPYEQAEFLAKVQELLG